MQKTEEPRKVIEFQIQDILAIVLIFVTAGIGTAYGLQVMGDVKADMTASSAEANATQDAIDGVAKFPEKFGLLATIIIAAIIIGVLLRYLYVRNMK